LLNSDIALKIVGLLIENPAESFSINEISKRLSKVYAYVHKLVQQLSEEGAVKITKVGKSSICSINLNSFWSNAYIQSWFLSKVEELPEFSRLSLIKPETVKRFSRSGFLAYDLKKKELVFFTDDPKEKEDKSISEFSKLVSERKTSLSSLCILNNTENFVSALKKSVLEERIRRELE